MTFIVKVDRQRGSGRWGVLLRRGAGPKRDGSLTSASTCTDLMASSFFTSAIVAADWIESRESRYPKSSCRFDDSRGPVAIRKCEGLSLRAFAGMGGGERLGGRFLAVFGARHEKLWGPKPWRIKGTVFYTVRLVAADWLQELACGTNWACTCFDTDLAELNTMLQDCDNYHSTVRRASSKLECLKKVLLNIQAFESPLVGCMSNPSLVGPFVKSSGRSLG